MGYRITLDRGVLRAELFGRETVEQTKAFFKAVVSASRKTGCPCVLISVRSSKPIFQLERHGLIDYFRELSVTSSRRVALLGDTRDLRLSHDYLELIAPQPAQAQLGTGSLIVTVTSPASGSTVSGTVPVTASVTSVGALTVAGVQFKLDGNNLGAEDTSAPYSVSWNTTTAGNGSHTLTAVARDGLLGTLWTSNPVTVTVSNDTTAPSVPTGLTAAAVSSSQINLSWTASTDNVGVSGYRVFRGGTQIATTSTTSYANTGLSPSTTYSYTVAAYDAAVNLSAQSSSASATTQAPPDTTPPTVSITSPVSGATVGGTTSVTATASDNVGAVGVQFLLDGANLGAEDTATPYSMSWK